MYFPYFMTYIVIGFLISISAFLWALKNGQFKDQQRARFLPLEEEAPPRPAHMTPIRRYEVYALFLLALGGLSASGAVLIYALFFSGNP